MKRSLEWFAKPEHSRKAADLKLTPALRPELQMQLARSIENLILDMPLWLESIALQGEPTTLTRTAIMRKLEIMPWRLPVAYLVPCNAIEQMTPASQIRIRLAPCV